MSDAAAAGTGMPKSVVTGSATRDFAVHAFAINGTALVADRSGALYWPVEGALIVADLHLEKGSAAAARGRMLPPYDTRETLQRLAAVIQRFAPRTVIALGDSLHDVGAEDRMHRADCDILGCLQQGREWIWVHGNHDPEIAAGFGGQVVGELAIGGLALRHEPRMEAAAGEIAGHLHPAARITVRGSGIRRRCFVHDRLRLVLPAFGAFTGGLNILDPAFQPLFAGSTQALMLGATGVYPIASALLLPD